MNKKVSIIGQFNIDFIFSNLNHFPMLGKEVFAEDFEIDLGGGPMVIPIQLNRLGVDAQLGTFYTDDFISKVGLSLLEKHQFDNVVNFEVDLEKPVVTTSVFTDDKERSFVTHNKGASELMVKEADLMAFYHEADIAFCPQDIAFAKKVKAQGTTLFYDVGWHENLSLESIKPYLEISDYFTPNQLEAEKITGKKELKESLDVLGQFIDTPIIKLGSKGSVCKYKDKYYHVSSLKNITAIDTTGAGDNFLTGFIYGLIHDYDFLSSLKFANILGGLTTEVMGCYRTDITANLLTSLFDEIEVTEVDDMEDL